MSLLIALSAAACSKGANEGAEEAKREAEREQKQKEATGGVAKKINPPVPGRAKLPCNQVVNTELFKQALGESEDVTVEEKADADAAASCSIIRGGKKLTPKEQEAKLKKEPRLGILPGDEICNVSTFCWTIEEAERFQKRCIDEDKLNKVDESLGFSACLRVFPVGADDINRWRFYDDDTKCVIQVRGGPSNANNDLIGKCAKAAHDLIGPDQIKVGAAPAEKKSDEPAADGSGSGS